MEHGTCVHWLVIGQAKTYTGKSCAEKFTQDNIWYVRTVRNYIVHVSITNTGKSCAENFTQDNIWYVRTVRNYIVHVLQIARSISKSIYVFLNFHQRRNECMHKWISWPCFDWHFLAGKRFVAWNTRLKSKNPTSDIRNENYLPCSSRSP